MENDIEIDFVVLWVDGNDLKWQQKKEYWLKKEKGEINVTSSRYRDWDLFKYWFRCAEKNAPWVRKIFLVTDDQFPPFLKTEHEKLVWIRHKDFMKPDFLPCFNSNSIELQIGNIPGLSEHFVLFNDDVFITKPVEKSFFFRNGKPVDYFSEYYFPAKTVFYKTLSNNIRLINREFGCKRKVIINNVGLGKWFSPELFLKRWFFNLFFFIFNKKFVGFFIPHSSHAYKKSVWNECISVFQHEVDESIRNRFRSSSDITHYLMHYYRILKGDFVLDRTCDGMFFTVHDHKKIAKYLSRSNSKKCVICVNDLPDLDETEFDAQRNKLACIFECAFPMASSFELSSNE